MRIAILSALKVTENDGRRAFLPFFGRSVLAWQTDFALSWGCKRVICLAESFAPELIEVQKYVEAQDCEFHVVRGHAQLVALMTSDDELLVMMDGLIVDRDLLHRLELISENADGSVSVVSAQSEVAKQSHDNFERIDAKQNWGGVLVLKSSIALKLEECPPDGDTISLLLRLGLQAGLPCEFYSNDALKSPGTLAFSAQIAYAHQHTLIPEQDLGSLRFAPMTALAGLTARQLLKRQAPHFGFMVVIAAMVIALVGATVVWTGYPVTGLSFSAVALLLLRLGTTFDDLFSAVSRSENTMDRLAIVSPAADTVIVVALIGALPLTLQQSVLAIFAIGLARLATSHSPPVAREFWNDRALQVFGFALACGFGVLGQALALFGLGALGYKILQSRPK